MTPVVPLEPALEGDNLRAESRRLTLDLVRAQLQLAVTIAGFGESKPKNPKLEHACRDAAAQGCQLIQRLLPQVDEIERVGLSATLERLQPLADGQNANFHANGHSSLHENGANTPAVAANGTKQGQRLLRADLLTRREVEVLKYIAQGYSTKKIADILGITFKTAACHRYRVMDKLGIHETANLVRYAIRLGMVAA